jgi:hypothetical protein
MNTHIKCDCHGRRYLRWVGGYRRKRRFDFNEYGRDLEIVYEKIEVTTVLYSFDHMLCSNVQVYCASQGFSLQVILRSDRSLSSKNITILRDMYKTRHERDCF